MNKLGERIRQIRKWRGFSQSELEQRCGIKREYLSKLENSDLKNPTFSTMLKISSALGIPLTSLIEAVDKPLPNVEPVIRVVSSHQAKDSLKKGAGSNYFAVPIVSAEVVAKNPLYLSGEDINDYAMGPSGWVEGKKDPNRYRCLLIGQGDRSMCPLLSGGSIVCFDTHSCDPYKLERQIVVLRDHEGTAIVRNLKIGDGYLVAVPENLKEYCLNIFSIQREKPIIGKVVWYLKQVRG